MASLAFLQRFIMSDVRLLIRGGGGVLSIKRMRSYRDSVNIGPSDPLQRTRSVTLYWHRVDPLLHYRWMGDKTTHFSALGLI